MTQLLETLVALETELFDPSVRMSRERLLEILDPTFSEIGRSGRTHTHADVLADLPNAPMQPRIEAWDFAAWMLSEDVALLTYASANVTDTGEHERLARRASIWRRSRSGWQIVFHQGTPIGDGGPS